ncbi:uncharacterized protein LOC143180120 [Calliopsis andreniformis]|uniref:uncharacterized protein LOC143180120 n=1 Tax=Calliopsis andreniformis TaxID=337506 RepID=UPI003FCCDA77
MSDLSSQDCEESLLISSDRKLKIGGTKWELPIPNSKEYWSKFCDEEEKKLLVVRHPFLNISFNSFSNKDTNFVSKTFNSNVFSNLCIGSSTVSENSLHKLSSSELNLNINKDYSNNGELFPKSILKAPSRAPSKSSATPCNLDTLSKVTRIPKLDTSSTRPSFARIFPGKVDHIRASFSVQNEAKAQVENLPVCSPTLPILNALPANSALKKPQKNLSQYSKCNYTRLPQENNALGMKSTLSPQKSVETARKEERRDVGVLESSREEPSLKYSIRCAYKALKYLTKDKKSGSKHRTIKHSFRKSSSESLATGVEESGLFKSKKFRRHKQGDIESLQGKSKRKSLKDSQLADIDIERATLKLEETMSKTIPSGSRSTSGPSPKFVYPEPWESPSSRFLSSIPKLSGFPRRNCDRCLSCMYKSFEAPTKKRLSFPMTLLQRTLSPQSTRVSSSSSSSEDSISISLANLRDELERIVSSEAETKNVTFDEKDISESQIVKAVSTLSKEKCEEIVEAAERKNVPDSELSHKTITETEDQREDDLTSAGKNLNDTSSCAQVASLEQLKVSSSFHSESSVEDDSLAISISDSQSKQQFIAPCHAPINLRPSLEPLRALRNRKPTTLQDRIVLNESSSMKKTISADDDDDDPQKPRSKDTSNKSKTGDEQKAPPLGRTLMKAKSVSEQLTLENAKLETLRKEDRVLRKATSLSNFTVLEEDVSDKAGVCHKASRDTVKELEPLQDDYSRTTPTISKLPITSIQEITEILENLDENASSMTMLDTLCKEFSERISKNVGDAYAKRNNKLIATLTRLLVDSKRYLYPEKFPSNLLFSTNQPPPCNPRILKRILPLKTYNLIAPILGLPEWYPIKETSFDREDILHEYIENNSSETTPGSPDDSLASLEVHPSTLEDTESVGNEEKGGQRKYNPYALFLMKPRRKVITWRPLTERDLEGYDPDATLLMKADNMMKKICEDFCEWLETLGGTDKTIDEEVLRDMFEIDFNAEACKAMQVLIQEMPVVPAEVALTRNTPGASRLAMTKRHVMRDVKAEETPEHTKAFGKYLPWEVQFVPPKNQVRKNWLWCEHVPEDLDTMEVVWKDITHLKSVRGFVEWLQQHPKVPRPEALKTIVSMDVEALRQIEEDDTFAHLEMDLDQITSLRVADSSDAIA